MYTISFKFFCAISFLGLFVVDSIRQICIQCNGHRSANRECISVGRFPLNLHNLKYFRRFGLQLHWKKFDSCFPVFFGLLKPGDGLLSTGCHRYLTGVTISQWNIYFNDVCSNYLVIIQRFSSNTAFRSLVSRYMIPYMRMRGNIVKQSCTDIGVRRVRLGSNIHVFWVMSSRFRRCYFVFWLDGVPYFSARSSSMAESIVIVFEFRSEFGVVGKRTADNASKNPAHYICDPSLFTFLDVQLGRQVVKCGKPLFSPVNLWPHTHKHTHILPL